MATLQLEPIKVTTNLEKFGGTVLPKDIPATIRYLFLSEMEGQQRLGNKPTTILVDNGRRDILAVQTRAQAFFSNAARIAAAANDAWQNLVRLTRIKSGAARRSYSVYVNERPIAGPEQIDTVVKAMGVGDFISIVGPGVPYGRKLFWRPAGKARKIKKARGYVKLKDGTKALVKGTYTEPMHRAVKRLLAKKYPDLTITDRWIPLQHGSGRAGERWPAISISIKSSRNSLLH